MLENTLTRYLKGTVIGYTEGRLTTDIVKGRLQVLLYLAEIEGFKALEGVVNRIISAIDNGGQVRIENIGGGAYKILTQGPHGPLQ